MCKAVNRNRTADMNDNIKAGPELEIIFPSEAIAQRLGELAREIANERADSLMVVAILKGSFVFAADLIRALHRVGLAPEVIVDDVLDSGRTLAFAKDLIAARGAKAIKTCVLLDKRVKRAVNIEPDYCAFECPDTFVVGYGMDVAHRYRELPFVGRVVRE
jgi:hypoxanthine phosphoribosyltransferase